MEEFIIDGKKVQVMSKDDVSREIAQAAAEMREADLSGKTLKSISLAEKNLDHGINLENAYVIGNIFLGNTTVNGNINMANATVDGSFFFGRGKLMGNLILEKTWVGQTVNLVGLNITGSLLFRQMRVNGFLSLSKAVVLGNIDLRQIEARDYSHGEMRIKGDIFFQNAQINGSLDLDGALTTGEINLDNALVRRNLLAKNLKIGGVLSLKGLICAKESADFTGTAPDKIIKE